MSSLDGISPLSAVSGPLVPELDRAALQPYQLVQFYNLQELRMTTPIAYRDGARAAARIEAMRSEPSPPADRDRWTDASLPRTDRAPESQAAPRLPPPREAGHSTTILERTPDTPATSPRSMESKGPTEDALPPLEPLPYGADPARIRALVDEMVSGTAIVPFTVHYRQAGDLVPVAPPTTEKAFASVRQVNAVYKSV